MSTPDDVRQHIISSLFSRSDNGTAEETLISYVKVYEDEGGGDAGLKTRYLMLAVTKLGKVVVHKAKRNNNLSFSKGKTWQLEDMRALEQIGPTDFALTMTIRRYHWSTEKANEQQHFLNSLVKVYKTYTKGDLPELINFTVPDERRPSSFTTPTLSRPSELQPPQMRGQRTGSSSSVHTAQIPVPESRSRPSLDGDRPSFGRSPLGESSSARRPSDVPAGPSPSNAPAAPAPARRPSEVGIGPPPRVGPTIAPRRSSDERVRTERQTSFNSEYATRQPSRDDLLVIAEAETPRSDSPEVMPATESLRSETVIDIPRPDIAKDTLRPAGPSRPPRSREISNGTTDGALNGTPTITTTLPSPSIPQEEPRTMARRASFHPPPLNTAFSREVLLTARSGLLPGAGVLMEDDEGGEDAVMANVEEMLKNFDWTATVGDGRKKGSADAIESRLLDELAALDSANIHAFLESDDRIAQVLGHIEEALLELEDIDLQITGYKMQLNAVSEDISYIESQNRGLQVQTSNQQALLNEIRQLLQIVEVPPDDLRVLTQESPGSQRGVHTLERAAASLYKALQAGMDQANAEVSATILRMKEYQENSAQFCKRILDYLDVTFKYQSDTTLSGYRKSARKSQALAAHTSMGEYLMMYEGLVLYVKEMDEDRYQRLCSIYMSTISQLHQSEMKDLLMSFIAQLNAAGGDTNEAAFTSAAGTNAPKPSALQKSKAAVGLRSSDPVKVDRKSDGNALKVADLYQKALSEVINQIITEEDFINTFLHLTDTESTFADHMELDSYFRRQAARHAQRGMSPGLTQLVRSMMDLIFGFVDQELKNWVEAAFDRNPVSIVGVIAVTERLANEAEEENTSMFFAQLFDRLLARQRATLDAFVNEQIRTIDQARQNMKKRKGVAFFVRHFPVFVEKMEAQLEGAESLPIRGKVNDIYERVVNAVFGSLQQVAKMDRGDQSAEDKGQLNYPVIMLENMHQFVEDASKLTAPSLAFHVQRAKGIYEENMATFVKLILRRSFARSMDFFEGIERLMQTTSPTEISLHASFSRSALKKVLKDSGAKDMRKAIDAMAKRVDKLFTDDDPVAMNDPATQAMIQTVWREVTTELKRETARAQEIIGKCFAESNLGLEYGTGDVEAACKRAK